MKTTRDGTLTTCVTCGQTWNGDAVGCSCPALVVAFEDGDFAMGPETMSVRQLCERLFSAPTVPISANGVTAVMMREGLAEVSATHQQPWQRPRATPRGARKLRRA